MPDEVPLLTRFARVATLGAVLSVALTTAALFAFGKDWVPKFISGNELEMAHRMRLIRWTLGAAGVGALFAVIAELVVWRRRLRSDAVERALLLVSPLVVVGFLPQLLRVEPWVNRHEILLPLVLALALGTEVLAYHSLGLVPGRVLELLDRLRGKLPGFWKKHGPLILVVLAALGYAAFMSFYNIRWHQKLRTHNFDLSIDNNLIFRALHGYHMESTVTHGNSPGAYLAAHAKLGQYVILPVYALFPRPETLMVLQGTLLGLGALPLYGFARRHVSDWTAAAVSLAYLVYYPLHCNNFVESKYLSLACFFILATFWAVERKKWLLFPLAFVAALVMREDIPVGLAVGGVFLLLTGHRPKSGTLIALISVGWFLYLRSRMDKAGSWWFPGMYKGLWATGEEGYSSVLKTVLTNPLFVLNEVLEKEKLVYLMHMLVPLVLLPARRWQLWAAFIPGTALTLFVTDYKPIQGFSFQYVMHWIPYLFLAAPLALAAMTKDGPTGPRRAHAAVVAMAFASLVLSYQYGAFARRPNSVRGGYFQIDFTFSAEERQRYADLKRVIGDVPPQASVVASENVGPHVSSRTHMYAMRRGLYDAEYIAIARTELDFEQTRKLLTEAAKSGAYGVVQRAGDFALLKKGADASGNAALIQEWKL
ncbi:MAG: DUF2079 domain-containing protein [Myxococcales bacterium]|nr:DUF2079 domain-containing protein [Myxococcales bacterium]